MMLRTFIRHAVLCALLLLACGCATGAGGPHDAVRVLFVGNSLTYVGNLPAVLQAQAQADGRDLSTQMLVQGGATLDDRVRDGAVAELLQHGRFDYVVLQERGGDALCFQPGTCEASERAHLALGALAHAHGAVPIVLGTYQTLPGASAALVDAERDLATRIAARFVPVSEVFRCARAAAPGLDWYAADGMHPGHDLTLLMATRLYLKIFCIVPRVHALTVSAPMFGPEARFDGSRPGDAQSVQAPHGAHRYEAARVATIIGTSGLAPCTSMPAAVG
jgi:hypothetical protein